MADFSGGDCPGTSAFGLQNLFLKSGITGISLDGDVHSSCNFFQGADLRFGVRFLLFYFNLSGDSSLFFRNRRRNRLAGDHLHRAKARRARFIAGSAFNALVLVNDMDFVLAAFNRQPGISGSRSYRPGTYPDQYSRRRLHSIICLSRHGRKIHPILLCFPDATPVFPFFLS